MPYTDPRGEAPEWLQARWNTLNEALKNENNMYMRYKTHIRRDELYAIANDMGVLIDDSNYVSVDFGDKHRYTHEAYDAMLKHFEKSREIVVSETATALIEEDAHRYLALSKLLIELGAGIDVLTEGRG